MRILITLTVLTLVGTACGRPPQAPTPPQAPPVPAWFKDTGPTDRFQATNGKWYERGSDGYYREVPGPVTGPAVPVRPFRQGATTPPTSAQPVAGSSSWSPDGTVTGVTITSAPGVVQFGTTSGCPNGQCGAPTRSGLFRR